MPLRVIQHYSDWVCTAVMSNDVMKDLQSRRSFITSVLHKMLSHRLALYTRSAFVFQLAIVKYVNKFSVLILTFKCSITVLNFLLWTDWDYNLNRGRMFFVR